jgi:tRNA1(Val) A37 N6-methylase TrmN6
MARLDAIARALYYPTPDRVVGIIGDTVRLDDSEGAALLDPCAGEGTAAAALAQRWHALSYGVELHKARAEAAARVLTWAQQGSYHQLTATTEAGEPLTSEGHYPAVGARPFGILFLNPPYDDGTDETGANMRQEVEFLRATTPFLAPGGLLVFIPPRKILKIEAFREFMQRNYLDIRAYAFPAPEVDAFDQVVVLARRGNSSGYCYSDVSVFDDVDALPSLDTAEPYEISVPVVTARVAMVGRAPESYEPLENEGAWLAQQWDAHTGEGAAHSLTPLVAPRHGHQAMLLAAGALNGLELSADGARLLVKGGSRKARARRSIVSGSRRICPYWISRPGSLIRGKSRTIKPKLVIGSSCTARLLLVASLRLTPRNSVPRTWTHTISPACGRLASCPDVPSRRSCRFSARPQQPSCIAGTADPRQAVDVAATRP